MEHKSVSATPTYFLGKSQKELSYATESKSQPTSSVVHTAPELNILLVVLKSF